MLYFIFTSFRSRRFDFPESEPEPEEIELVHVGANGMDPGDFSFSLPSFGSLTAAAGHMTGNLNDFATLVGQTYLGRDFAYAEYGVSGIFCTDHDTNLNAIQTNARDQSFAFNHNVRWNGTVFLQLVTQCHAAGGPGNGRGGWWKGEQWYAMRSYPVAPTQQIYLRFMEETRCRLPVFPAEEYGCGPGDW